MPLDHNLHLIAHRVANLAKWLKTLLQITVADSMAAEIDQLWVKDPLECAPLLPLTRSMRHIIKGPNLHARDALTQQILCERARIRHKANQVLIMARRPAIAAIPRRTASRAISRAATGVISLNAITRRPAQQLP